jgi:DNA (cytosine-5)-methyltransferase 1
LYCGVGGLSLGFEQAGFEIAAAFDSDPIHVATYSKNFPGTAVDLVDLAKEGGDGLRRRAGLVGVDIDVVIGGPPCQGFSTIGKRDPADPRNDLLIHFARLVGELSPTYFVLENVPGLRAGDPRAFLASFLRTVRAAGYRVLLPMKVLQASDFGVPQQRGRLFVVGYKKGAVKPGYPVPLKKVLASYRVPTVWEAIRDLPQVERYHRLLTDNIWRGRLGKPSEYASLLRGEALDPSDMSYPRRVNGGGLTGCQRTAHTRESVRRFLRTPPGSFEPRSRLYRLSADGLSHTIRAGTGPANGSFMAPRPIHPTAPRCITVREGARLQAFPDWFEFHSTKWHAFRQIGNSVPPPLARAVASALLAAITEGSHLLPAGEDRRRVG